MDTSAIKMATPVEKENINQLTFPKTEVVTDDLKREERDNRIVRAMRLGNNKKIKVKIHFEDDTEIKKVETTIWGVTEKNIILKQETIIPINRVHEIKFF